MHTKINLGLRWRLGVDDMEVTRIVLTSEEVAALNTEQIVVAGRPGKVLLPLFFAADTDLDALGQPGWAIEVGSEIQLGWLPGAGFLRAIKLPGDILALSQDEIAVDTASSLYPSQCLSNLDEMIGAPLAIKILGALSVYDQGAFLSDYPARFTVAFQAVPWTTFPTGTATLNITVVDGTLTPVSGAAVTVTPVEGGDPILLESGVNGVVPSTQITAPMLILIEATKNALSGSLGPLTVAINRTKDLTVTIS